MANRENQPLRTTETLVAISNADVAVNTSYFLRVAQYLMEFDSNHLNPDFNPVELLKKICELMEEVIDIYLNSDPDPMDDRHPHRLHPESAYGTVLKIMFKNDNFMTKLVVSYLLHRDNVELNIQGCRLLLACVPGLDSKVVFAEPEDFVPKLYEWAKDGSNETLQGYAMGLLASALDNPENASKYRNENVVLVPVAINVLRQLEYRMVEKQREEKAKEEQRVKFSLQKIENEPVSSQEPQFSISNVSQTSVLLKEGTSNNSQPPPKKRKTEPCLQNLLKAELAPRVPSVQNLKNLDESDSKWDIMQPFLIGNQQIYPPTLATFQRFVLQYLASCGEYQDLLYQTFEGNALQLLLDYMDLEKTQDVKVTFDALKYLTSLLVHRKFALEFAKRGGIEVLLRVPRTSLASVGVVTAFYYIAYSNDVCELICQMPAETCDEIVQYVLWCLEHSYESGMASACLFFAQTLFFKAILRRFDEFDGPRKLCNFLSTLTIMQNDMVLEMTEEQVHTSTQCVRGVCTAYKNYLAAHIFKKIEVLKNTYGSHLPTGQRFPELVQERPDYKSMKDYEEIAWDCESIVAEMFRVTGETWKEAENMRKLGMVRLFMSVRMHSKDWLNVTALFRNEMSVNAFDCIAKLMCYPPMQLELLPEHVYDSGEKLDGFAVLMRAALGVYDEEGSTRVAALGSIQRCIVIESESMKFWKDFTRNPTREQREHHHEMRRHLEKMWMAVRKCDGLLSLIKLVNCKIPVIEADSIRLMATKCLTGLARNAEVRQILTKLPIIAHSQLHFLMREPVCSDKRAIHAAFCKAATLLLQVVTGRKHQDQQGDPKSLHDVKGQTDKAYHAWVVENTKVTYNGTELLQLIHDHLTNAGLPQAAAALRSEAKLPDRPASRSIAAPIPMAPWPCYTKDAFTKFDIPTLAPRILESSIGGSVRRQSQMPQLISSSPMSKRSASTENDETFATPTLPPRRNTNSNFPKKLSISPASTMTSWKRKLAWGPEERPVRDLDNIMVEYFRNQHSSCKNPVTTCPEFSLFYPHKCPERTPVTPVRNLSFRVLEKFDVLRPNQRIVSQWNNERDMYSKFRSARTIHDHEESYTSATFSVDDEHIITGFFNGEVHWINVETGVDEGHTTCHHSAIGYVEQSQDGSLLCTSSLYVKPLSALWRLGEQMQRMHIYKHATCLKFANTTNSRIIGTESKRATIYDVETNHVVKKFESRGVRYEARNFASFSPDDSLVFNAGHLWDVRKSGNQVHVFERLNHKTQFGVFHPNGTQIIINTEVYDIRNFRCVHHVPELDQCSIKFTANGNIMFATELHDLQRDDLPEMVYSSFRTFDTRDYSSLTTVEGRRPVLDLCVANRDTKLAVVEQNRPSVATDYMVQAASHLRLFEIGRKKDNEDDVEEEDDEPHEEHEEIDETDSEEDPEDDDDEGTLDTSRSPNRSVFDALGRLQLGEESEEGSGDDLDVEDVINRMMRNANRRNRPNMSPMIQRVPGQPEGDEPLVLNAEEEQMRQLAQMRAAQEEAEDPDFDVGAAMDELIAQVDEELMDDGDSDSDGTWETASQIGPDDINLDLLNADDARAAEQGEFLVHLEQQQQLQEQQVQPEGVEAGPAAPAPVPVPAAPAHPTRRYRRTQIGEVARQLMEEIDEQLGIGEQQPPQSLLSARVEEQRAQMMEAYREQNPERPPRRERLYDYRDEPHYMEEEEEIISVSTCPLNPNLRRRQRRARRNQGPRPPGPQDPPQPPPRP